MINPQKLASQNMKEILYPVFVSGEETRKQVVGYGKSSFVVTSTKLMEPRRPGVISLCPAGIWHRQWSVSSLVSLALILHLWNLAHCHHT